MGLKSNIFCILTINISGNQGIIYTFETVKNNNILSFNLTF